MEMHIVKGQHKERMHVARVALYKYVRYLVRICLKCVTSIDA